MSWQLAAAALSLVLVILSGALIVAAAVNSLTEEIRKGEKEE